MRQATTLVSILACAVTLSAQVNKSNLTGIVRDSSGAAAAGVAITLTNTNTGAARNETSDNSGFYPSRCSIAGRIVWKPR